MISCLEYALIQNSDIILMQESWIETNQISIFHFSFDRIIFYISFDLIDEIKFKIMAFISKKSKFQITFKSDISNDSNI